MSSGITFYSPHLAYEYAKSKRAEGFIARTELIRDKNITKYVVRTRGEGKSLESKENFIQRNISAIRDSTLRSIISDYAKIAYDNANEHDINEAAYKLSQILEREKDNIIAASALHSPEETEQMIDYAIENLHISNPRTQKVLAIDYAMNKIHDGMLEEYLSETVEDGERAINVLNALANE